MKKDWHIICSNIKSEKFYLYVRLKLRKITIVKSVEAKELPAPPSTFCNKIKIHFSNKLNILDYCEAFKQSDNF